MEIQVNSIKRRNAAQKIIKLAELDKYLKKEKNYYIWIDTHYEERGYKKLLNSLSLHPKVLEHAIALNERPVLQVSKELLFSISYLPYLKKNKAIEYEEVNFILTNNLLITIKKEPNESLTKIINQVKRYDFLKDGPDNTMGHLVNYFCTEYYPIIEYIEEEKEELEKLQLEQKDKHFLVHLKQLKSLVLELKRHVIYQRTILEQIVGRKIKFINDKDSFNDAAHKILDIYHSLESIDMTLNSLLDTHLNIVSINMGRVMKVLTIVAAVFMPLSFLTSWYGMNFYMPEIHFKYSYLTFFIASMIITLVMLIVFGRKKWF